MAYDMSDDETEADMTGVPAPDPGVRRKPRAGVTELERPQAQAPPR